MSVLLTEALPEFAIELIGLLLQQGYPEFANQVPTLHILSRCQCGDDFCGTMYTAIKPQGRWSGNHDCIDLDAETGMVVLDIVDDRIVCIETLYRPEIRKRLLEVFPQRETA